jgi:hypothetical protein
MSRETEPPPDATQNTGVSSNGGGGGDDGDTDVQESWYKRNRHLIGALLWIGVLAGLNVVAAFLWPDEMNVVWVRVVVAIGLTFLAAQGIDGRLETAKKELKRYEKKGLKRIAEQVALLSAIDKKGPELFLNEYNKTADRYENIYKAIWQIFSYMSFVTAGILTFGGKDYRSLTITVAMVPLMFWYLTTFIPMDHYGHQNGLYLDMLKQSLFKHGAGKHALSKQGGHYSKTGAAKPPWHVHVSVHRFALLVGWVFFFALLTTMGGMLEGKQRGESKPAAVEIRADTVQVRAPQIDSARAELESLRARTATLDSMLRARAQLDSALVRALEQSGTAGQQP